MENKYNYQRLYEQEIDTPFARTREVVRNYFNEGKPKDIESNTDYVSCNTAWLVVSDRERRKGDLSEAVSAIGNAPLYYVGSSRSSVDKLYNATLRRLDRIMDEAKGEDRKRAILLGKKIQEIYAINIREIESRELTPQGTSRSKKLKGESI